jgi:DUF4097 and DUF4098 domain-containing protein YvlB
MKPVLRIAVLAVFCPSMMSAQSKIEVSDLQHHPFSVVFPSGGKIRIQLRSGDFRIVGSDDNKITVKLSGTKADDARDLTVRFKPSSTEAELRVFGGPKNDLQVTINVPKNTGLFVRMPAGELAVEGISGDKDVELHAGDLTISGNNAADYSRVDASVTSGDLEAPPFGESHGGLFRSFHKTGTGKYQLHAHVGAGDLTLN